jgi:hypothetical protein
MANYDQPAYVDKRVRFFDGQFLRDQDFIDEQKYHLDRQRRHVRALTVSGVVEGLDVDGAIDQVTVQAGTALDSHGRQLLLPSPSAPVSVKDYRNQTVTLLIEYAEEASDQAQEGSAGHARFHERPRLFIVPQDQAVPEDAVVLAALVIDNEGQVIVDPALRKYAGVRLPCQRPSQHWPSLRADATGQLALAADLNISGKLEVLGGKVGVGVSPHRDVALQVQGDSRWGGGIAAGHEQAAVVLGELDGVAQLGGQRGDLGAWADLAINSGGGNVGIGTATPQDKLDLHGALRFNGDADTRLYASTRASAKSLVMKAHWDELEIKGRVIDWTGTDLHIGYGNNHSNHAVLIGTGGLRAVELQGKTSLVVGGDATVKGDLNLSGRLRLDGGAPIRIEEYRLESALTTDYSVSEWEAAVIGFASHDGEIAKDVIAQIMFVHTRNDRGRWRVLVHFLSNKRRGQWTVRVMFIRKELVG